MPLADFLRCAYHSRAVSSASELPRPRFAPASVDASHQIALEIRRYLEREGLQPGGSDRHRAGAGGGVRRQPPDAARGPAAARQLAPDPRRPRPRRRHLRRPHAGRGHEPQRQRVDLDDAGHGERLAVRAARRADVPRGAARRASRPPTPTEETAAELQAAIDDGRRPRARARRRSTTPTSASTRSSPAPPATSCCWRSRTGSSRCCSRS